MGDLHNPADAARSLRPAQCEKPRSVPRIGRRQWIHDVPVSEIAAIPVFRIIGKIGCSKWGGAGIIRLRRPRNETATESSNSLMAQFEAKPKRSSQGQLVIWDGMKLSTMFRFFALKPSLRWNRALQIATLPAFCAYNSFMGAVENLIYGRKIQQAKIDHAPIFILGYWRSGTTLLHNLMTLDPRFTYPSLYQCVFPWHFLTTEKVATRLTSWLVPKSRPMDNIELSWNAPQEDDVALCAMTLLSPYVLLARPFDDVHWRRSFELDRVTLPERVEWENAITLLMKKITVRHDKTIVLKSPSHTYRIPQLLRLFPHAKFIYIHRNPYDIFNSAIHLRKTMAEENSLGDPVQPNIENSVLDTIVQGFEVYERDKELIPPGALHEVRYDDLADDPEAELERIYQGLDLGGFEEVRKLLQPQLADLKRYKKNRFVPNDRWQQEVYRRAREIYDRYGYPEPAATTDPLAAPATR